MAATLRSRSASGAYLSLAQGEVGQSGEERGARQGRNLANAPSIGGGGHIAPCGELSGGHQINARFFCLQWRDHLETEHAAVGFLHGRVKSRHVPQVAELFANRARGGRVFRSL